MRLLTIITAVLILVGLSINLVGCEGRYRYPCQDPANWGRTECNNDVCKAEGTCTSDTLAKAGTRELGLETKVEAPMGEENSLEDTETEISNDTTTECAKPKQLSYRSSEEETIFNVKHKEIETPSQGNSSITREVITIADDAAEQPVTSKSEVDATIHDEATK